MLSLLAWDASPGLYSSHFHMLLVYGSFGPNCCLQWVKIMLMLVEVRWLTWPLKNITFLCLEKHLHWFCSLIWVIIHLYCEALSCHFWSIWLNLSRQYSHLHFRVQPATSISSHIINKHQWPSSIGSHTCLTHKTVSTMFDRWCSYFGSWAVPFLFHTLLVILACFCSLVSPVVCPLWETLCIYMKASLDCRLWQWYIYHLQSFLHLSRCTPCKEYFFTKEIVLRSFVLVFFCGLPDLLVLLGLPVHSFFQECSKLSIWLLLKFLPSVW